MTAALLPVFAWLLIVAALTVGVLLSRRACRWTRDDVEARRFISEIRAEPPAPVDGLATYVCRRDPVELRALAREIAEDAERIEGRRAARIEPAS